LYYWFIPSLCSGVGRCAAYDLNREGMDSSDLLQAVADGDCAALAFPKAQWTMRTLFVTN
jgi:hypothetical protein